MYASARETRAGEGEEKRWVGWGIEGGRGGRGGQNGEFFFETIRGASKKRTGQKKLEGNERAIIGKSWEEEGHICVERTLLEVEQTASDARTAVTSIPIILR